MPDHNHRHDAMVEFMGCFPTISGDAPQDIKDLSDGVILFEVMSDLCQEQFGTTTISRGNTNWALKANTLRKLTRNLESYFHTTLRKSADFSHLSEIISDIARNSDPDAIAEFVEIVTAACVTCEERGRYITWIMGMTEENQVVMKGVIESSLARIEDLNDSIFSAENDGEEDGEVDGDSMSDNDFEGGGEISGMFRNAMQNLDSVTQGMDDVTVASQSEFSHPNVHGGDADVVRERDELRAALAESKRELAAQKSNAETLAEDGEATQKKLRALAADLQERLEERQEELVETAEKLRKAQRGLDDADAKVSDLTENNASLEDELDIANAKATQLKKAEATVVAYRRKLEGAGVMNQQMSDLENQSAKYLGQIVDLEMEAKKIPDLQKNLDDTTRELNKFQKENADIAEKVVSRSAEVAKLKTELSASVTAKKMAEEELTELRIMQQSDHDEVDGEVNMAGLSLTSAFSVTEVREKVMRLEIENKSLKKQLDSSVAVSTSTAVAHTANMVDDATVKALENEIEQLQAELKKKDVATAKLASDKDKLESYTKKTLSKFQEKYLVALQECKAKLKEKHDKIEALEMRSAAEKSNQKKEEKLLSSTVYELGLMVMQQKLKNGQ
mmetsp:Transcript_21831/g.32379  ORF Transcript_21831/g.32379 Transcript_21831/m.32379 type:complete len:620 (+) Transcript_21831:214-2073(+)